MKTWPILVSIPLWCLLASCKRAEVDLPRTLAPEPAKVTVSANGFVGEINIDGGIVAVPRLHELIEPRMRGSMAETQVGAQMDIKARGVASAEGYFFRADWTSRPAGDRYLDVRGQVSTYSGGAHPMTSIEAFVWDRLGQRRLALADLLRDPSPGSAAVATLAGAAREALVAVKRARDPAYDPHKDTFIGMGPDGPFAADLAKFARNFQLVPRAADGSGGGIAFLYSPYDVGSWAEGAYEVTVPAAIAAPLLKPDASGVLR